MNKNLRKVDLVVISDLHLGTYGCHAKELNDYLMSINPGTVVLNGDIIDIWNFKKKSLSPDHINTISILLDFIKNGKKVYYITGNHDEFLRKFSNFKIRNFNLCDKLILGLNGKTVMIFHGDVFDFSINHYKWLAVFAGRGYDYIIRFNAWVNNLLVSFGYERISMAKQIKKKVKKAIKFISDFEMSAANLAIEKGFDYVICGHIHKPQNRKISNGKGSVTYLNSGDWVENLTSLEYSNGQWKIYSYYEDHKLSKTGHKVIKMEADPSAFSEGFVENQYSQTMGIIKMQIEGRF